MFVDETSLVSELCDPLETTNTLKIDLIVTKITQIVRTIENGI